MRLLFTLCFDFVCEAHDPNSGCELHLCMDCLCKHPLAPTGELTHVFTRVEITPDGAQDLAARCETLQRAEHVHWDSPMKRACRQRP